MNHSTGAAACLLAALTLSACGGSAGGGSSDSTLTNPPPPVTGESGALRVLSNRPDLVSGDDVLLEVVLPAGVSADNVVLTNNGGAASGAFGVAANGRYLARVTDLALGANTIGVELPGAPGSSVTVINHPNGGPVFSGPQVQPWVCQDTAIDAQCNQPAEFKFFYRSSDPSKSSGDSNDPDHPGLFAYDPTNPPSDVASTTTDQGVTLPFIVREERGYQDRDEYRILTLFRPGEPWEPWAPQDQWNHKLLITHGGGCGGAHTVGGAPLADLSGTPVVSETGGGSGKPTYVEALGRGFAVASTALDNNGHNCNIAVQAESLMMAKEHLIEQYGELRYTIGTGCSGGSLAQQQITNAYPGIYQGSLTMCSYPDTFSAGTQFADYHMLRLYFEPDQDTGQPKAQVPWTPQQMADVEGHVTHANAVAADEGLFKAAVNPSNLCAGITDEQVYKADSHPDGVRCGVIDYMINVFGPRPPEVWTANEQLLNRGFAGIPLGNVGIQYGLEALQDGKIAPAQFVDLNVLIGGLSVDIQPQQARTAADRTALANAYRSGAINTTNNLNRAAIINFTGPDPGVAHDSVHTFWTRWRLDREHGNHDNHVIWEGPAPLIGDPTYLVGGLIAMDRWLAAVEQDTGDTPLVAKLTARKPADIVDQCSDGQGHAVPGLCPEAVVPVYGTPRTVAGDVDTADTMECHLRPLNRADPYGPLGNPGTVVFTDAEWAQLQAAFPDGVCDYSQPGINLQDTITWMAYGDAVNNVYGGTPLPAAPVGVAPGWVSPAFSPPSP